MRRPSKADVEQEIVALDALDTKALQDRWRALYRRDPPPKFRPRLLRIGIAYRLQELAFGGLQPRTVRLLAKLAAELRAKQADPAEPLKGRARPAHLALAAGSQLVREWNGATERVDVTREGFRWRGQEYQTLSAVAVAITGTKWSGPKFFGLTAPSSRGGSVRLAPASTPAVAPTKVAGQRA